MPRKGSVDRGCSGETGPGGYAGPVRLGMSTRRRSGRVKGLAYLQRDPIGNLGWSFPLTLLSLCVTICPDDQVVRRRTD